MLSSRKTEEMKCEWSDEGKSRRSRKERLFRMNAEERAYRYFRRSACGLVTCLTSVRFQCSSLQFRIVNNVEAETQKCSKQAYIC